MKIKRFVAKNMTQALQRIKIELGDEAVILDTKRRIKKQAESGKEVQYIEITAAVDHEIEKKSSKKAARTNAYVPPSGAELAHTPLLILHQIFSGLGMDQRLQRALTCAFLNHYHSHPYVSYKDVWDWLRSYCLKAIKVQEEPFAAKNAKVRWAFVGPPGSGKTTNLAKLAARMKFHFGMKGLLLTTDTYRLGAAHQLERFATLMDIPYQVAVDPEDVARQLKANEDLDFILVDTIGRSPLDPAHKHELGHLLGTAPQLDCQVVISATDKNEDIAASIRFYKKFPTAGWIISKMDATKSYSSLLMPILGNKVPISYLSTGQRVPEDITRPSVEMLLSYLLKMPARYYKQQARTKTPNRKVA